LWIRTAFGSDTQSWRKNTFLGSLSAPFVTPAREACALSILDQRSIVALLHLKGHSTTAKDIHPELVPVLGSEAIAYSAVTNSRRNDVILQNEPETQDRAEDQGFSITDNAILEALEMMPFASIRQIAKMTIIPPTTAFGRLTKFLHFLLKRLRWVPQRLSDLPTHTRVIMSKKLRKLLDSMRHHSWPYILPLGEVWFYLSNFLLITNQFGSVQKMKFHKGREKLCHLRR
jgi:hypothetical protein